MSLQHSHGACFAIVENADQMMLVMVLLAISAKKLLTLFLMQAVSIQTSSGACFAKVDGPREGIEGDWEGEDVKV